MNTVVRAAVVGAGPSGFYTANQLLDSGFEVDMIDALPTPYGLVRAGVAPDHPKIKNVTRIFDKTANRLGFRYFGGVTVGRDVNCDDLRRHYHIIVYATGMSVSADLGVPGEGRPGSYGATEFVAWYNGHPDAADRDFGMRSERAVVIGNGNVAIDVARMLVTDPADLARTDMADHAISALAESSVREVVVIGRRGPLESAFTNPELRELGELRGVRVIVDPRELELDAAGERALVHASETAKINYELLREYSESVDDGSARRIVLKFHLSPRELLGDAPNAPISGIRLGRNRLDRNDDERATAVATGVEEIIDCGLVVRAVGYRGRPIPGLPFDPIRGRIRNLDGRVCDESGLTRPGEYVAGWVKRGASGIIGTNKKCATDTVRVILDDADRGKLNRAAEETSDAAEQMLVDRVPRHTTWRDWEALDRAEIDAGRPLSRPRLKFVRLADMSAVTEALR